MSEFVYGGRESFYAVCVFRYALGRTSYITGIVPEFLAANKDNLCEGDRILIIEETEKAIFHDRAGHKCDVESWEHMVAALKGETS